MFETRRGTGWLLAIALLALGSARPAQAQPAEAAGPTEWAGTYWVEGRDEQRALVVEGPERLRVPSLGGLSELDLRGPAPSPRARTLVLTGQGERGRRPPAVARSGGAGRPPGAKSRARALEGAGPTLQGLVRGERGPGQLRARAAAAPPPRGRQVAVRLEARAGVEGTLDVALVLDGRELVREVWQPAGRARVRLVACPARHDLDQGELTIELEVRGRPHQVLVRVDAANPERYPELAGLVQYEALGPLPVGRHRLRWSLRDRSFAAPRLEPGDYALRVASEPDATGLAPLGSDGHGPWSPPHLLRLDGVAASERAAPSWSPEDEEAWARYGDPAAPWPIAGDPPPVEPAAVGPKAGPSVTIPWPAAIRPADARRARPSRP